MDNPSSPPLYVQPGVRPVLGIKQLFLQAFEGPLKFGLPLLDAAARAARPALLNPNRQAPNRKP